MVVNMEKQKKITHNRAQCRKCGDIIESKSVHNWVQCKCGEIFVDGGLEYCHWGANDLENIIDMCEYESEEQNG